MINSGNSCCLDFAASALAVLRAFCANSGLNVNDPIAEAVACSRNLFLSNEYLAANRALLTLCKTCLCASGSYCREDFFGVTESVTVRFAANLANC